MRSERALRWLARWKWTHATSIVVSVASCKSSDIVASSRPSTRFCILETTRTVCHLGAADVRERLPTRVAWIHSRRLELRRARAHLARLELTEWLQLKADRYRDPETRTVVVDGVLVYQYSLRAEFVREIESAGSKVIHEDVLTPQPDNHPAIEAFMWVDAVKPEQREGSRMASSTWVQSGVDADTTAFPR